MITINLTRRISVLTIVLALLLPACTAPAQRVPVVPSCGLVAYYPFHGNANDESGNANHGVVHEARLSRVRSLSQNEAYEFDGVESFIDLGNRPVLKMTDGLTISVWVKPETFEPLYQNIVSDHSYDEIEVGPGKILRLYYNELQFHVGGVFGIDTAIYTRYPFESSALGSWHHLVGTYDRLSAKLYVDGVKVDARDYTEPLSVNNNAVLIGKSGFGEFFKGGIDEVRIYNRAISENEVQKLYTQPEGGDGC
jgi:hypothetical protein